MEEARNCGGLVVVGKEKDRVDYAKGSSVTNEKTAHRRFYEALVELGPTAPKLAKNPHFNSGFCPLPELLKIVCPVLHAHDLYLTQSQSPASHLGLAGLNTYVVSADDGLVVAESHAEIPYVGTDPQKWTTAITYARRTGITSVMALGEADDDGNSASKATAPPPMKAPPARQQAPKSAIEKQLEADGATLLETARGPSDEALKVLNAIGTECRKYASALGTTMQTPEGVNIVNSHYLLPCFAVPDWQSAQKLSVDVLKNGLEALKKKLAADAERKAKTA